MMGQTDNDFTDFLVRTNKTTITDCYLVGSDGFYIKTDCVKIIKGNKSSASTFFLPLSLSVLMLLVSII
ncbi:transmembrane domain protein [Sulfolobus ellipsoid virus 1]|uniref:Transmembrane domain protein n=1 Tax=Sulfolobus ellipsoid virus 1 TaxID=2056194 RepID=A0A2H4RBP2_9VIRU|nr:transmembrane domain protein [Sulfolobus ellipsoid virus 1]ATY46503.1 transmembrane domain protein [Sulfolobus ellipsoid virus 1]